MGRLLVSTGFHSQSFTDTMIMEGTWPGGSRPQGILQDLPRMNLQDLPRMNLQDLPINAHASVEWHEPPGSSEQCTRISHHLALSAQSRLMECGPATGWVQEDSTVQQRPDYVVFSFATERLLGSVVIDGTFDVDVAQVLRLEPLRAPPVQEVD